MKMKTTWVLSGVPAVRDYRELLQLMNRILTQAPEFNQADLVGFPLNAIYEGQHVKKGDQLGMFHFGGSTHTLIFRPQVDLAFDLHGQTPGLHAHNIPVRARIATVRSPGAE
jgi:hypothetical protein